jgi:hypothetical protein
VLIIADSAATDVGEHSVLSRGWKWDARPRPVDYTRGGGGRKAVGARQEIRKVIATD